MSDIKLKKSIFDVFSDYNSDSVLYAFFHISYIDRENLKKAFVLEHIDEQFVSISYNEENYKNAMNRMKKYLKEVNFKIDDFYTLYLKQGYLREEIDYVLNKYLLNYIELLNKKWGSDLRSNYDIVLSYEEMEIVYGIVPSIMFKKLKIYRKEHKLYGIEDLFDALTVLEIRNMVISFEESKRELYYYIFGEDLSKKYNSKEFKEIIKRYKSKLFENIRTNNDVDLREFYKIFISYKNSREGMKSFVTKIENAIVAVLTDDERDIIYRSYANCSEMSKYRISLEESKIIKKVIVPKIILYISPLKINDIYNSMRNLCSSIFTEEEIMEGINSLTDYEKIKLHNLDKLEEIVNSADYYDRIQNKGSKAIIEIVAKINIGLMKRKSKELGISIRTFRNIINLLKKYEFSYLEKLYGKNLALAIMIYTYIKTVNYDVIYKLTGILENECISKTYDYLLIKIDSLSKECNLSLDNLRKINLLLEDDNFVMLENQYGYNIALAIMIKTKIKKIDNAQIELITGEDVSKYMNSVQILSKKI